jgi:hypothetical protein
MKKTYSKPMVESESVFETLAAGCTFITHLDDASCDIGFSGVELQS